MAKTKKTDAPAAPAKAKKATGSQSDVDKVLSALSKSGRIEKGSTIKRKEKQSTGSIALDNELGGGIIRGKIVECFGRKGIGKTTMAYTLLAQYQDEPIGYIDCESNYDEETALMLGVNTENLLVGKPYYLEQALEQVMDMVEQGVKCIVYDSVAGLGPKVEMEGSMEDQNVGKRASRMNQLLRKLHLMADDAGCIVYFINQIRDNVGGGPYDPKYITPGGHGLEFHTSYRFHAMSTESIKAGEQVIGHLIRLKVEKSKFGRSGGTVLVPLIYGVGISQEKEVLDIALGEGWIVRKGSWYSHDGVNIGQGEVATLQFLRDNPEFFQELKSKVYEKNTVNA